MKKSYYRYLSFLCVLMFFFVTTGCSSGGSGGDDSGDGNYPDIVVSEEERTEALTSASAAFENLTDDTPEEASEQMAEYLNYGSDTVTISFDAIACQSPPDIAGER